MIENGELRCARYCHVLIRLDAALGVLAA